MEHEKQPHSAGAARQGGNTSDNGSSVLAQAGVRAEPTAWGLFWQHEGKEILQFPVGASKADCEGDLKMFDAAEQANMVIRPLYLAAPTTPAQVPAAEVRAQALEEAMRLLDMQSGWTEDEAKTVSTCITLLAILKRNPGMVPPVAQSSTADKADGARAMAALPGWERGIATVTMNGHQLREALEFISPDGDDQLDDELTFGIVKHKDDDGKETTGLCCWNDDTDGVLPLDGEPSTADKASEVRATEEGGA